MKKLMGAFLGMMLMAGCVSTPSVMNSLSVGMSRKDVIAQLGEPETMRAKENIETLGYKLKEEGAPEAAEPKECWVELKDGYVISYGRGWRFLDS